jgi:glycosyltransferase involved in cell wall biosynthesis
MWEAQSMDKRKILFILKSEYTPSARIRFLDLFPFLERAGIGFEVEYLPKSGSNRRSLFKKGSGFCGVVLQKRLPSLWDFKVLRKHARKLAFDFDDAVHLRNASPSENELEYVSSTRARRFRRIVGASDMVLVANNVLADAARAAAPAAEIAVIPSSVDVSPYPRPEDVAGTFSSPPVVGWVGTKVASTHLLHFVPALRKARAEEDFVLRVVSNGDFDISGLNVENIEWTLEGESRDIRGFDVGIMPLSDDPYSRGKSSYKLLQYMAAGVPALASAVGMNVEVAGEDGRAAFLAASQEEFTLKLLELLRDSETRRRLAFNGRSEVEKKYSREVVGLEFANVMARFIER